MSSFDSRPRAAREQPERVAALWALVTKYVKHSMKKRGALAGEVAGEAALSAFALFGPDSLVGARLLVEQSKSLGNHGFREAEKSAAMDFFTRRWASLMRALPIIRGRWEAGTLMFTSCRGEEEFYVRHEQIAVAEAAGNPPHHPAALAMLAPTVGYVCALEACNAAMVQLPGPWPRAEKCVAQAFVLDALDLIRAAAALPFQSQAELDLVKTIQKDTKREHYDPKFHAALIAKSNSPAVRDALLSRGALQGGVAASERAYAQFEARRADDIRAHGLKACALPACGKREATVAQFKLCSGCRAVAYCSGEHASAHWPEAHRRECKALKEARSQQA